MFLKSMKQAPETNETSSEKSFSEPAKKKLKLMFSSEQQHLATKHKEKQAKADTKTKTTNYTDPMQTDGNQQALSQKSMKRRGAT